MCNYYIKWLIYNKILKYVILSPLFVYQIFKMACKRKRP
jgi:hypothetical protein